MGASLSFKATHNNEKMEHCSTTQEMPAFTGPISPGHDTTEAHAVRPLSQPSSKQPPSQEPAPKPSDEAAAEPAEAAEPEAEAAEVGHPPQPAQSLEEWSGAKSGNVCPKNDV